MAMQSPPQAHHEPPMDALDLVFLVVAAIVPAVGIPLALLQYWARRSPAVVALLLDSTGVPLLGEGSSVTHALLPGAAKLLPAPESTPADAPPGTPAGRTDTAAPLSLAAWRDALNESPHLLIYGPSKAGKSTFAQAYVATLGACAYVVIDPQPNKPNERKWGGIDFVTLDDTGDDEYASIKAALQCIKAEDTRRRKAMRHETFTPLIIIIDEVLSLVDALGTTTNAEGKKEPLMAHFIRTMGYSARHRNIKIILIGQGKNLNDLGLTSGTARNNYALVRVSRNAATNERGAFIVTDAGDQPMDLQHVPRLAAAATQQARLWLSHSDLAPHTSANDDEFLSSLLASAVESVPVHQDEKTPFSDNHIGMCTGMYRYSTEAVQGITMLDTDGTAVLAEQTNPIPDDDEAVMIRALVEAGYSRNKIAALLGGSKSTALARIRRALGEG